MKTPLIFIHILLCSAAYAQPDPDSLDKANAKAVIFSGNYITKAIIDKDSAIWLQADMKKDHRFFGYEKPDKLSKRLILFSIFTNDVENNPFGCLYGAYYETSRLIPRELMFVSKNGNFIKAKLVSSETNTPVVYMYFEKKWFRFRK